MSLVRLFVFLLACILAGPVICQDRAGEIWLQCGDILDVRAGRLQGPATVVVSGDEIASVSHEPGAPPADARVIDLGEYTCLPGLMDMHTHLSSRSGPNSYRERFTLDAADLALRAAHHARITLEAGFTTVRDLGDSFNVTVALRDAVHASTVPGPRIYTSAKSLATTGGHADPTNSWRADLMGEPGPVEGVVDGVAAARQAVRQRYKDGADLIKITATGGVLSVAKSGLNPQFRPDELEAVIETARDYDMHVAAHAHGSEGMKRAIIAGIHSIEHGTEMNAEIMDLMREHGTWYVPTISAGKFVAEKAEIDGYYPEMVRSKARNIGPRMQDTFGEAYRAGVKIAFGTDCGVCDHGTNAREFVYMTEAGMPPAEAIRAATVHAAELLGVAGEAGALEAGMWADVIAVPGDPLESVKRLQEVRFVMKAGAVYTTPNPD